MLSTLKIAAIAMGLAVSSLAIADTDNELDALQAYTITSENHTAVVFYTKLENGKYEVVTAIGSNPGVPKLMTQTRVTLDEGQTYSFELDQGLDGGKSQAIQITAAADKIRVANR